MSAAVDVPSARPRPLRVGLVNNLPRVARRTSERQFRDLASQAIGGAPVEIVRFHLEGISAPDPTARPASPASLDAAALDALIVTGAEPAAPALEDEPFWPALAVVAEWAATRPLASYWSCLAAHAAVLHLDGVRRRPLAAKCSGVFAVATADDAPLGQAGAVRSMKSAPHSRMNDVCEADLVAAGYRVQTRSAEVGVDAFLRPGPGAFLLHQGHPEYDGDMLAQEWRRDLQRFVDGERTHASDPPRDYFRDADAFELARLWRPRDPSAANACIQALARMNMPPSRWREAATDLFSVWLQAICDHNALVTVAGRDRGEASAASIRPRPFVPEQVRPWEARRIASAE